MRAVRRHCHFVTIATTVALATSLLLPVPARADIYGAEAGPTSAAWGVRLRAVDKAMRWLRNEQQSDGGWGAAEPSSAAATAAVLWALGTAGEDSTRLRTAGGTTPLDALDNLAAQEAATASGTARLILALVAGGADPRHFRGLDAVSTLEGYGRPSGRYAVSSSDGIRAQAWALLALRASDRSIPAAAANWLRSQQNGDGGWGEIPGQISNTADTSWTLQALATAGTAADDAAIVRGVSFLRRQVVNGAGFRCDQGSWGSDASCTGLALLGLAAAGDWLLDASLQRSGQSPFDALLQHQLPSGGFVFHAGDSEPSAEATAYAVLGLLGQPLPSRGPRYAVQRAVDWLHTQQMPDGSFGGGTVTADAVRTLILAGEDPDDQTWTIGGWSALEAMEQLLATQPVLQNDSGMLGKVLRAAAMAGSDPHSFGGLDLVARLGQLYDPNTGWYHSGSAFKHAMAIEGLLAAGESVPAAAVQVLLGEQRADGGWGWPIGGDGSDVDTTGQIVATLAHSGVTSEHPAVADALLYLQTKQLAGAGWGGFLEGSPANSNSVALVTEGLLSVGQDPRREPFVRSTSQGALITPLDALLSFQEPSGAFLYTEAQPESRLLAVLDAIPALLQALPSFASEGAATVAGTLSVSSAGPGRLRVLVSYEGDGDADGVASLRFRDAGGSWSSAPILKYGVLYAALLEGLAPRAQIEIEVTISDPDGVEGAARQTAAAVSPIGLWLPIVTKVAE